MHKSRLTRIGNSTGVVLPQDVLGSVGLRRGDEVVISVDEAGVRIAPADSQHARAMDLVDACIARYGRTLSDLAK